MEAIIIFERDAIDVNVRPGGLTSTTQIRILICYLLNVIEKPVGTDDLKNTLHFEGLANYFEVCNAIAELEKNGHITTVEHQDKLCYVATASGMNIAKELAEDVPKTVKEYAVEAINKVQIRERNERENKVEIENLDFGCRVTCIATDGIREILKVSLFVPDEYCAKMVKERFLNDPSHVYLGISDILTL